MYRVVLSTYIGYSMVISSYISYSMVIKTYNGYSVVISTYVAYSVVIHLMRGGGGRGDFEIVNAQFCTRKEKST